MSQRYFYSSTITEFLCCQDELVLGLMTRDSQFGLEVNQRDAWLEQFRILRSALSSYDGQIIFEYSIPRMGKRVDAIVIIGAVIFVLEFKVGAHRFDRTDLDQVWDYALDLSNFQKESHNRIIAPILVATNAKQISYDIHFSSEYDKVYYPIKSTPSCLAGIFSNILSSSTEPSLNSSGWADGIYSPTPTIVEAAQALYGGHSVKEISRTDASAKNLQTTSEAINSIIQNAKDNRQKAICFVTGVPGAGKTLVGLNIATSHTDKGSELYSVFLSGNGPLVAVLREALARDEVAREKAKGNRITKKVASSRVQMFIQNVHHFRDDCLASKDTPPVEHVALFDEAQRAWNLEQTAKFMKQKKNVASFHMSEPEFLISCMDRHPDWAVIVCLVGGGQEINSGEAGISEWVNALRRSFSHWDIYISPHLTDSEYGAGEVLATLRNKSLVHYNDDLHLSVSMRSFRAENVSLLVKQALDRDIQGARETLGQLGRYPICITRDLHKAKSWLRQKARGTERIGIVTSSQALRLKPYAIDIRPKVDPVHWFLSGKDDVRSSYYLEDVATEFQVQGLELDWACVTWDADFCPTTDGWAYKSFCGSRWQNINQKERKGYLKNAYRVLLTRARQGMVIFVPEGDPADHTRLPAFYDPIYAYLADIGFEVL